MSGSEKYGYSELEQPQLDENLLTKDHYTVNNQDAREIKDLNELKSLANKEEGEVNKAIIADLTDLVGRIEAPREPHQAEDLDGSFGMHMLDEETAHVNLETVA